MNHHPWVASACDEPVWSKIGFNMPTSSFTWCDFVAVHDLFTACDFFTTHNIFLFAICDHFTSHDLFTTYNLSTTHHLLTTYHLFTVQDLFKSAGFLHFVRSFCSSLQSFHNASSLHYSRLLPLYNVSSAWLTWFLGGAQFFLTTYYHSICWLTMTQERLCWWKITAVTTTYITNQTIMRYKSWLKQSVSK